MTIGNLCEKHRNQISFGNKISLLPTRQWTHKNRSPLLERFPFQCLFRCSPCARWSHVQYGMAWTVLFGSMFFRSRTTTIRARPPAACPLALKHSAMSLPTRDSLEAMKRVDLQRLCKVCSRPVFPIFSLALIVVQTQGLRRESKPQD
jgi:hypothetical protein